jgi:hypothetical protein
MLCSTFGSAGSTTHDTNQEWLGHTSYQLRSGTGPGRTHFYLTKWYLILPGFIHSVVYMPWLRRKLWMGGWREE